MKLSAALLATLLCSASTSAQYFSQGWNPGQAVLNNEPNAVPAHAFDAPAKKEPAPAPPPPPPAAQGDEKPSMQREPTIMDKVLLSGPVSGFMGRFGFNATDLVTRSGKLPWDPRIPFITDENWQDIIVNEQLTEEEEKKRGWFLVITVTASGNSAVSKMVDEAFDDAFNTTLAAGDLLDLKWGRIDYIATTYLTTKWAIWTGPYLVHVMDRGQTLRFYRADRVRVTADIIRELLTEEIWRNTEPWSSNFAPGGKREWIMEFIAYYYWRIYTVMDKTPRFLLMIVSGAVASFVMRFLHKPSPEGAQQPAPQPNRAASAAKSTSESIAGSSTAVASDVSASPSKSKAKSRKAAKK
ncbi:uncharacterized protein BXZ73DRAFT_87570 [Epithele typhae]|uniref:uncharacterized protein n=1 Tax=Epithele typhae TaxID=378194 RepID=UPI00200750B7|nr:uncharacterized protein BXZ73DRAFT_87570 [Epithele typhae]KAH9943182.1 hypothetical protein BXZ73DRAFT_87570 [Epithele typhae]